MYVKYVEYNIRDANSLKYVSKLIKKLTDVKKDFSIESKKGEMLLSHRRTRQREQEE